MANHAANVTEGEQDMSMEDILKSIRDIIAEDETHVAEAPDAAQEEAGAFGSDVLELTDVAEEQKAESLSPETTDARDILKEIDEASMPTAPPPAPPAPPPEPIETSSEEDIAPALPPAPVAAAPVSDSDRLLSQAVADASAASLKRIIDTHKATSPMPHFRSGTTLEDLVLETLKPVLKEWLDAELPSMVERIVEREIRKLVD